MKSEMNTENVDMTNSIDAQPFRLRKCSEYSHTFYWNEERKMSRKIRWKIVIQSQNDQLQNLSSNNPL